MTDKSLLLLLGFMAMAWSSPNGATDLQRYFEQAKQNNPQLLINQGQYHINQAQKRQARAALMPKISLSSSLGQSSVSSAQGDVNSQVHTIRLEQAVFDGSVLHRLSQANDRVEQSQLAIKLALEQLMLEVAQSYVNMVLAQTQLTLAEQEANVNQRLLDRAESQYRVGNGRKVDFLQAKAAYQLSKSTLIARKNTLRSRRLRLQTLTGQPIETASPLRINETHIGQAQQTLIKALAQGLRSNLDLQQLRKVLSAAQSNVLAVRRGALLPSLSLSASHTTTEYEQERATLTNNQNRSLALNLNWVLFDGLGNYARIDEARWQQRIHEINIEDFINNLEQQIEQLAGRIETGLDQIPALEALVDARENEHAATNEGFALGLVELSEVITVQNLLSSAKLDLNQSRLQLWLDHLQLKQVTGQLTEQDLRKALR